MSTNNKNNEMFIRSLNEAFDRRDFYVSDDVLSKMSVKVDASNWSFSDYIGFADTYIDYCQDHDGSVEEFVEKYGF